MSANLVTGRTRDAFFAAVDALCIMGGTVRPSLADDPIYIIERKGCQAIVALKEAGIANNTVVAELSGRLTAAELAIAETLLVAQDAQTSANAAAADAATALASAEGAQTDALAAQVAAAAAQATADEALALAGEKTEFFTAEYKDAATVYPGMAVAAHSSGSGIVRASNVGTTAIGLATTTTAFTFAVTFQTGNVLTLDDWTRATGGASLSALGTYFLGATPGTLSLTAPTAVGSRVQIVGRAIAPKSLRLSLDFPILN